MRYFFCQKSNCKSNSPFSAFFRLFPPFSLFQRIRLLDFPALFFIVVHHWSNDGMVSYHRWSLSQTLRISIGFWCWSQNLNPNGRNSASCLKAQNWQKGVLESWIRPGPLFWWPIYMDQSASSSSVHLRRCWQLPKENPTESIWVQCAVQWQTWFSKEVVFSLAGWAVEVRPCRWRPLYPKCTCTHALPFSLSPPKLST